ncbi:MAG: hypothetical protein WC668_03645 [Patescibacteria group bacterium]|jgi:hypothetical protein
MDFLSLLGLFVILASGVGIGCLIKNKKALVVGNKVAKQPRNLVSLDTPPPMHKRLEQTLAQQTITLLGESERAVKASVTLWEMFKKTPDSPWSKTEAVSKALALAGGIWIFKVPSQEGGKPIWLRATKLESMSLMKFYKGVEGKPGPARIFKENDQSEPVPYELPSSLTSGVTWEIIDIGTFDAQVDGECDAIENDDRLYFVTSRERGGDRQLIYLDARKGEARGSGGLFLGEKFEPSVDVSDLL